MVCIVRSLIKKKKIIIMDEVTANINEEIENLIDSVVKQSFQDSSVVIITHKINTLMSLDRLVVIDSGRVIKCDQLHNFEQI